MKRRDFLQTTTHAAMAWPFLKVPDFMKEMRMGIVVHSYGIRWNSTAKSKTYPGFANAIELMEHCHDIGAGGVQVSVRDWSADFSRAVRDKRENLGLFLEGSIALPEGKQDLSRFAKEIIAAKEAGAGVVRTVCLSGRRYEKFQTYSSFKQFRENSVAFLELAESIVRKHKVLLAVENHKDWRAEELVGIMKKLDSEWIGVNLDFGNNVALIEDPMEVVKALAPYTFTTHVKDMGVKEYADGFLLSEVPLGEGILDLKKMFAICKQSRADIKFNLEMITRDPLKIPCLTDDFWKTMPAVSAKELAETLRNVKQNTFPRDLPVVSGLAPEDQLAAEERNILASLQYSTEVLGMN